MTEVVAFISGFFGGAGIAIFGMRKWYLRSANKAIAGFKPSTRPEPKVATVFVQKTKGGETGKIARVRPLHIRQKRNNNPER